jgi:hypothetical protein
LPPVIVYFDWRISPLFSPLLFSNHLLSPFIFGDEDHNFLLC